MRAARRPGLGPRREAAFLDDVRWYDGVLRKDDYVRGVALWTLGQWEGYDANFQAVPAATGGVDRRRG
ncbi:MAG: hypothetical protein M5R40_06660 [Anaerolineae bacterium]|nr:hypothetical protein [Anaerolineae bacterium]